MSNVRVRHSCPEGIGIDKPSLGQKMRIKRLQIIVFQFIQGYVLFATIHENTLSKTEVARSEGSGQQTGGREIESKK